MKSSVYIETSIVSYYTSRPNRDIIIAARQQQTHDWWNSQMKNFDVFISKMTLDEIADGDTTAAEKRLHVVKKFPLLDLNKAVFILSEGLILSKVMPKEYPEDALHVAVAAAHGIEFILTWNFAHINNAATKRNIEIYISNHGYECPVICTPEELMGE
ncbi:MAG: type II toxin-antitoxin system VapC family toxin [Candidatus Scalindua sp.]